MRYRRVHSESTKIIGNKQLVVEKAEQVKWHILINPTFAQTAIILVQSQDRQDATDEKKKSDQAMQRRSSRVDLKSLATCIPKLY